MSNVAQPLITRFERGRFSTERRSVVQEFPVRLKVNHRELATLVASPHQLNFLVAGFLRNQGFIRQRDDLLTLGICSDFGLAQVQIKGELPERLMPTLTSGCGTGITFHLDHDAPAASTIENTPLAASAIPALMRALAQKADQYRQHGGIHSAAVGRGAELLLFAEDLGRHNTLDRIAGEALLKGIDLTGTLLVTSGRISTEMVAKAARLGITTLASRTSPTDQAVELCQQLGITLVGYARGEKYEVYTHPQRIVLDEAPPCRFPGITGVILAGGESRRMGSDKSLLPLAGARFIDHIYRTLEPLFDELLIVTNSPSLYSSIPCPKVPDIYVAQGALAGVHAAVHHARNDKVFVVACDMPSLNPEVVSALCEHAAEGDVVLPVGEDGAQPLHALYDKRCLPAMERVLDAGQRRIVRFFNAVTVVEVPAASLSHLDPQQRSFRNINTPEEYFALRDDRHDQTVSLPRRRFGA